MPNPIIQMLDGNSRTQTTLSSNISSFIQAVKGNPQGMYNQLIQTNPNFANFVQQNKGLSPEQIAQKYGIDISLLKQFM